MWNDCSIGGLELTPTGPDGLCIAFKGFHTSRIHLGSSSSPFGCPFHNIFHTSTQHHLWCLVNSKSLTSKPKKAGVRTTVTGFNETYPSLIWQYPESVCFVFLMNICYNQMVNWNTSIGFAELPASQSQDNHVCRFCWTGQKMMTLMAFWGLRLSRPNMVVHAQKWLFTIFSRLFTIFSRSVFFWFFARFV